MFRSFTQMKEFKIQFEIYTHGTIGLLDSRRNYFLNIFFSVRLQSIIISSVSNSERKMLRDYFQSSLWSFVAEAKIISKISDRSFKVTASCVRCKPCFFKVTLAHNKTFLHFSCNFHTDFHLFSASSLIVLFILFLFLVHLSSIIFLFFIFLHCAHTNFPFIFSSAENNIFSHVLRTKKKSPKHSKNTEILRKTRRRFLIFLYNLNSWKLFL